MPTAWQLFQPGGLKGSPRTPSPIPAPCSGQGRKSKVSTCGSGTPAQTGPSPSSSAVCSFLLSPELPGLRLCFIPELTSLRGQASSGQPPPIFALLLFLEHIHPAKRIFSSTFIQGLAKCWGREEAPLGEASDEYNPARAAAEAGCGRSCGREDWSFQSQVLGWIYIPRSSLGSSGKMHLPHRAVSRNPLQEAAERGIGTVLSSEGEAALARFPGAVVRREVRDTRLGLKRETRTGRGAWRLAWLLWGGWGTGRVRGAEAQV